MSSLPTPVSQGVSRARHVLRTVRDRLPGAATRRELAELRESVAQLRDEVDECRRDSLRIAELTDIVESRLAGTTSEGP